MDIDALKTDLAPIFRKHAEVLVAYLIGSAARGDMHERSDLDFAVLLQDDSIDVYTALWADLHDVLAPMPFDLAILNGADPVFAFEVIREGVPGAGTRTRVTSGRSATTTSRSGPRNGYQERDRPRAAEAP